jgi:hypothetical protein
MRSDWSIPDGGEDEADDVAHGVVRNIRPVCIGHQDEVLG